MSFALRLFWPASLLSRAIQEHGGNQQVHYSIFQRIRDTEIRRETWFKLVVGCELAVQCPALAIPFRCTTQIALAVLADSSKLHVDEHGNVSNSTFGHDILISRLVV